MQPAGMGDGNRLSVGDFARGRRSARLRGLILLGALVLSVGVVGQTTDGGRTPPFAGAMLAMATGDGYARPAPLPPGTPTLAGVDGHHILDYGLVLTRPDGHGQAAIPPAEAVAIAEAQRGNNLDAVTGPILAWVTDHSQPVHREPCLCWLVALRSEAAQPTFGPGGDYGHTTVIVVDARSGALYAVLLGFA